MYVMHYYFLSDIIFAVLLNNCKLPNKKINTGESGTQYLNQARKVLDAAGYGNAR